MHRIGPVGQVTKPGRARLVGRHFGAELARKPAEFFIDLAKHACEPAGRKWRARRLGHA